MDRTDSLAPLSDRCIELLWLFGSHCSSFSIVSAFVGRPSAAGVASPLVCSLSDCLESIQIDRHMNWGRSLRKQSTCSLPESVTMKILIRWATCGIPCQIGSNEMVSMNWTRQSNSAHWSGWDHWCRYRPPLLPPPQLLHHRPCYPPNMSRSRWNWMDLSWPSMMPSLVGDRRSEWVTLTHSLWDIHTRTGSFAS